MNVAERDDIGSAPVAPGQPRSKNESTTASHAWRDIPISEVDSFNRHLLRTAASVLQYPYWNEPYRQLGLQPIFLHWNDGNETTAYVCILALKFGFLRIGLVFRGPVGLDDGYVPNSALEDLYRWAVSNRFLFLRFTHSDSELLSRIAGLGPSYRSDAFPFYEDVAASNHDLLLDLTRPEDEILAGFDKEIRRQIRKASETGYEIRLSDSVEAMEQAWPMFEECGRKKGFRLQKTLQAYTEMIGMARLHGCVRLYQVHLAGKLVQVGLILRDRDRAWNVLLARNTDTLRSHLSPGPWMHWQVMRDMRRDGVLEYNLGLAVGSVGHFKLQFHPRIATYPPPVTLVANRPLHALWRMLLPLTSNTLPAARDIFLRARG